VPSTSMPNDLRVIRYSGQRDIGVAIWPSIQWPSAWSW
jgi:hypothetical protein